MWSKVLKPTTVSTSSFGETRRDPSQPTARQGHTFTPVSASKTVLFGGVDASGALLNDAYVFDLGERGACMLSSATLHCKLDWWRPRCRKAVQPNLQWQP